MRRLLARGFFSLIAIVLRLPASAEVGTVSGLNSLPEVPFAELSQADQNPLGAKALAINEATLGKDHPRTVETRVLLQKIEAEIAKKKE